MPTTITAPDPESNAVKMSLCTLRSAALVE